MARQVDELAALRATILMFADSMLSDLRTIRHAQTIEEAQTPINGMIERVNALADAAEPATAEKGLRKRAPTQGPDAIVDEARRTSGVEAVQ